MPLDLSALDAAIAAFPKPQPVAPSPEYLARAGKSISNLPVNMITGLAQSAENLTNIGNPGGQPEKVNIPNFFDIPQATNRGEGLIDMVLGKSGFADIIGQSLVPAGIVGKLGKAAGIAEGPGLEALKWGAGFAGPELQRPDATGTDVAIAGGLGASQGALSFLPRKARLLPTLGVAAAHGLYETAQHDPTTGLIAFGSDLVGGMLPSHISVEPSIRGDIPIDTGEVTPIFHDDPQGPIQYHLYKQQLAKQEALQAAQEAIDRANLAQQQGSIEGFSPNLGGPQINSLREGGLSGIGGLPHADFSQTGTPLDVVSPEQLQASFQASLPDPTTAAGVAMRRVPLEPPNRFATLQIPEAEPQSQLLHPPDIISGVEPRPDVSLFTGQEQPNPNPFFPVEQNFGGGVRSDAEIAAMQKAQKPKRVRKPKAVVPEPEPEAAPVAPEVPASNSTAAPPTGAYAEQLRARYGAMSKQDLQATIDDLNGAIADTLDPNDKASYYSAKSVAESILNGPEKAVEIRTNKDIGALKAAADSGDAGAKKALKKAVSELGYGNGDRITYTDTFRQQEHGVYKGMTPDGRAKVRFDGDTENSFVPHSSLKAAEGDATGIPEFATLQKLKEQAKAKTFTPEEEDALSKFLAGEETEAPPDEIAGQDFNEDDMNSFMSRTGAGEGVDQTQEKPISAAIFHKETGRMFTGPNHGLAQDELINAGLSHTDPTIEGFLTNKGRFLDRKKAQALKANNLKGTIFKDEAISEQFDSINKYQKPTEFNTRSGPSPRGLNIGTRELPAPAAKTANQIVSAIKDIVSKHLQFEIKSGEHFDSSVPARSTPKGVIQLNKDSLIQQFDNYNNVGALEKAQKLANFARILGHEVGHTVLNFMSAKNPRLLGKLINEFNELGLEARINILKEFHDLVGQHDTVSLFYSAGEKEILSKSYHIDPNNTFGTNLLGMHEFFAELSAAHIFGKLKEEMLPPEIKSLWQKFKDLIAHVINKLFDEPTPDFDNIDQKLAYDNFHKMMTDLHDRFSTLNETQYREYSQRSSSFVNRQFERIRSEDVKAQNASVLQDMQAGTEREAQEERELAQWNRDYAAGKFIENPNYDPTAPQENFATLQNYFNAPPIQASQPIVGNQAYIKAQLARHLGYGIAGGIAGGILGPNFSGDKMTVAEGVFAGAVLGFAGPIVLKRLLMSMPKAGAQFQHIPAKDAFKMLFTSDGLKALGGDAANGQGSAPAMFVRWLERNMNLHLPKELFNAVVKAEGPASYALQIASDAFEKARTFKTNPNIDNAVVDYLRGRSSISTFRQALGGDPAAQQFANFIITGRSSIALLQEMTASGLRDGSFKTQVVASLQKGDYLTRMYRMFHDPDYKPSQRQIESLALELKSANPEYDLSTARIQVEDYLHQIQTERGMYSGSKSDVGQKLDAVLFQPKNNTLSAVFRDAMGEYTDPKEQVMGTIRHLYTNAISGKFYDQISTMRDSIGLKMSYERGEHGITAESIQAQLKRPSAGTTPEQIATLQKQLKELQYYVPLDTSVRYGKLAGKMVSRFVRDQLASFDSPWGLMDGSIMRSLAGFHNYIKIARTALNPITVVRNMVSAPILMGMARANPLYSGVAMKAIKDMSSGLGREMLEQGIYGVDQVRGEFFRASDQILTGDYNHNSIEGIFKSGMNKVLEFYRMPDMLARGTSYITAKKRFAGEFNLPESDMRVINAARDWTNRYTVNYANVAPIVKSLRQVPFTNLFISFTSEMVRITKNLVQDIFEHPNPGQRVFAAGAVGALAGIPFLLEKASVMNLSQKDQELWGQMKQNMPDYARSRFQIIIGKDGDKFRYLDLTPIMHTNGLLEMMRTVVGGDWKAFAAVNPIFGWDNTPIMNVVSEQISGKDLRTQRPIDTNYMTRMREVLKEIVPPLAPGGYEFNRAVDAFSRTDKGDLGITNIKTGHRTTPGEFVESYLTGMRLTTVDPQYLQKNVVSDAKRQIANEASYYRDIAVTDLPQSVKDKAALRYQTAVKKIIEDMQNRLGLPQRNNNN